jgi:hypothetical protein
MADNAKDEAHSEATKWFMAALVITILYVSTVLVFVLNGELGDEGGRENGQSGVEDHGKSH